MSTHWDQVISGVRPHLKFSASERLLDYWVSISSPGTPPDRRDIDPLALTGSLKHVFVIDLVQETQRLRYRVAGEQIEGRYEQSLVGRYLDEITGGDSRERVQAYVRACPERQAIVLLSGVLFAERATLAHGERLLLPLIDRDTAERSLIGLTSQTDSPVPIRPSTDRILRIAQLDGAPIEVLENY